MDARTATAARMTGRFDSSISFEGLFSGRYRKPTVILILAPLIITTWKYFGSKHFYFIQFADVFSINGNPALTAELYTFVSAFLLMGVVPYLVIRFVFGESLVDYGVQIGDWSFGWKAFAVMAPVMVLLTIPSASMPDFIAEYPVYKGAGSSAGAFLFHALSYLFFYLGWEMLFRGFMQFGLRGLGDWNAILIQTSLSCIAHIGKPTGEIYSSILGALVWGIVVFRSRSLLYVLAVHWLLGVALDWFIVFG
ncbi:MAG: hypothetical protein A3H45_08820 [Ignavibacteria bacterium RIFCSPLOWO2_02_FULL_55_14]|nr:MAG: hypothetical protein A3H45_08820 [Ignavibacteria bacterium RIFCSPLOWO2_02_FULL_55_14]